MSGKPNIPHRLGKYRGKTYWRYHVVVSQDGLDSDLWHGEASCDVIASKPEDAANLVRDELCDKVDYPTSVVTCGPKGRIVERFIGYMTLIGSRIGISRRETQLNLNL